MASVEDQHRECVKKGIKMERQVLTKTFMAFVVLLNQ